MQLNEIKNAERGDRRPLQGVRILALEQMQALPYATQLLGHLGADVVKIEHPETGDSGRGASPAITDLDGRRVGATYLRNNLSKRSLAIDLKTPMGRDLVKRLVPRFDIVCENFTPGSVTRLGVDYEALRVHRADLIYCSISGFGQHGTSPYADYPAYAPVVEAMGGLYEPTRREGQAPETVVAGALGDNAAALFAVIGMLTARRAERSFHARWRVSESTTRPHRRGRDSRSLRRSRRGYERKINTSSKTCSRCTARRARSR